MVTKRAKVSIGDMSANQAIEAWLDGWAVQWVLHPGVSTSDFDSKRSMQNQARLGDPLDPELVERYTTALKAGSVFPPVVAWRAKEGKLVVIDGNHRLAAAIEADYDVAVYEVTAKPQAITTMTFEANVRHGKATSSDERVHHALYLVDNGMSVAEAARRMNVPQSKVTKALAGVKARRRASTAGISAKDWESIAESARNRLYQIGTDEALAAAVQFTLEASLSATQVFELVAAVNDTRSAAQQLAAIRTMREAMREQVQDAQAGAAPAKGKRARSPKGALATTLGLMLVLPDTDSIVGSLGQAEREEYGERLDSAIDRLTELRKALV